MQPLTLILKFSTRGLCLLCSLVWTAIPILLRCRRITLQRCHYDSYSNNVICLNERWHTWFCIYKRLALECGISHAVHVEEVSGPVRYKSWDTSGYFQEALKNDYNFALEELDPKHQFCFIHYGAFSKNRNIHEWNVAPYRRLQILRKRGIFGHNDGLVGRVDGWIKRLGNIINRLCFGHVDRSKYWPGWGQG